MTSCDLLLFALVKGSSAHRFPHSLMHTPACTVQGVWRYERGAASVVPLGKHIFLLVQRHREQWETLS